MIEWMALSGEINIFHYQNYLELNILISFFLLDTFGVCGLSHVIGHLQT